MNLETKTICAIRSIVRIAPAGGEAISGCMLQAAHLVPADLAVSQVDLNRMHNNLVWVYKCNEICN